MTQDFTQLESNETSQCDFADERLRVTLGLPMEVYLDDPSWSSSDLTNIRRSPEYMIWKRENRKGSKTQAFGTAAHTAILEPDKLLERYGVRPEGHGNSRAVKDAIAEISEAGKIALKVEEWDLLHRMTDKIAKHKRAKELIELSTLKESSFMVDLGQRQNRWGLTGKIRPDALLPQAGMIIDVKTTRSITPDQFLWEASRYHYAQSAAWYLDVMADVRRHYTGQYTMTEKAAPLQHLGVTDELDIALRADYSDHIIIAIENEAPCDVQVYELDGASLDLGRMQYEDSLKILNRCIDLNEWPGMSQNVLPLVLPNRDFANYDREKLLEDLRAQTKREEND